MFESEDSLLVWAIESGFGVVIELGDVYKVSCWNKWVINESIIRLCKYPQNNRFKRKLKYANL